MKINGTANYFQIQVIFLFNTDFGMKIFFQERERWYQRKAVCKDSFFVILGSPIFRDMPQAFVKIIDRILEKNFTTPTAQIMPPLFH